MPNYFEKSLDLFPIKRELAFFAHCSASPLYSNALNREKEFAEAHHNSGIVFVAKHYHRILDSLRESSAKLLQTASENVAFVKNTSEGLSLIANGYPFSPGDQVIGFIHEYPANVYPWRLQERRGMRRIARWEIWSMKP
jgi:cysteine desulfurase/selenocysteine lyase